MLDVSLAANLLRALAPPGAGRGCQLVFVGDADQLPPVGPGLVRIEPMRAALRLS
jgi:ATP-dependent exoDNAse (exonuclease V) alpha subunit